MIFKEFQIQSIDELSKVAEQLIELTNNHKIIAFYGEIGVGKTTFIKAICKALVVQEEVNSPTFSLVNEYYSEKLQQPIYHFDFYRINNEEEVYDIGFEDYLDSGNYCFIEWTQNIQNLLEGDYVSVKIQEINTKRKITIQYL